MFDVFDSAISYLGINWNRLGHIVETPDNNTSYRWKHEKVAPSYKYVLKLLQATLQEGFRRDRAFADTVVPLRKLVIRELEKYPDGHVITIPESPAYSFELQGDWVRKDKYYWSSKTKGILRKTRDLVESDKALTYLAELILEDG